MKIGDRVYVHGNVDEIRKDTVIIRNEGGYFGTVKSEIIEAQKAEDIVSVVRCRDCKWYDMTDPSGTVEPIGYRCKRVNRIWREPHDFCSRAERKEQ